MQHVILKTIKGRGQDARAQGDVQRRRIGRQAAESQLAALDAGDIEYVVSRPEGGVERILNRARIEAAEILAGLELVG